MILIFYIKTIKDPIISNPLIISFDLAWRSTVTECVKWKTFLVMTRETKKMKVEIWVSKTWPLILVSLLTVDSRFTLKYSSISTTQIKSSSKTSRPSFLLIHWVRHTSIDLQFVLPCSHFFIKFCKCSARIGEKFKKILHVFNYLILPSWELVGQLSRLHISIHYCPSSSPPFLVLISQLSVVSIN